jgi:hypothetical protein
MKLVDVMWSTPVNVISVVCDCSAGLIHPARISLVTCPYCGRQELWHAVDPKPASGPWSERVMDNEIGKASAAISGKRAEQLS